MSISLAKLKRAVGMQIRGSGGDFDFAFYSAVNDVISDLIAVTVIDDEGLTAIDEENPPASLEINEAYYPAFRDGVPYYMQKNALWARVGEEVSDAVYRRTLGEVQALAIELNRPPTGFDYEE